MLQNWRWGWGWGWQGKSNFTTTKRGVKTGFSHAKVLSHGFRSFSHTEGWGGGAQHFSNSLKSRGDDKFCPVSWVMQKVSDLFFPPLCSPLPIINDWSLRRQNKMKRNVV